MVWVGGRDGHRKVGAHPLGTSDLRLLIRKEPLPYGEARREWRASILLVAESLLMGTRVGAPVLEELALELVDRRSTCASSPFYDGHWVTGWSHLYRRRSSSIRRGISPPLSFEMVRGI